MLHEVVDSEYTVEEEPYHHDGREAYPELSSAEGLNHEQDDEDST